MTIISLRGSELGFERETGGLVFKGQIRNARKVVYITSTQLLTLFGTPQIIVPAPGAGKAILLHSLQIYKEAGTAYGGIAAGEDLVAKYTNAAGAQASSVVETTGFLDQTTVQTRVVGRPGSVTTVAADVTPVANTPLVLHILTGDVTTGTGGLYVQTMYDVITMALNLQSP